MQSIYGQLVTRPNRFCLTSLQQPGVGLADQLPRILTTRAFGPLLLIQIVLTLYAQRSPLAYGATAILPQPSEGSAFCLSRSAGRSTVNHETAAAPAAAATNHV
jgi:hypothetical protein